MRPIIRAWAPTPAAAGARKKEKRKKGKKEKGDRFVFFTLMLTRQTVLE
ncbi:hypothetical protein ACAW63_04560 [Pseudomonas sp. QE6]